MKKRTKIIILTVMVLLLGVTGYLNIMLNKSISEPQTTTTSSSYFASFRTDREAAHNKQLLEFDSVISDETLSTEVRDKAALDKLNVAAQFKTELVLEGLIKAKGFDDAIVTINNENINVIVKADTLSSTDVSKIKNVIQTELGTDIENIKVMRAVQKA